MTERLVDKNPCIKCERSINCGACDEPDKWIYRIKKKLAEYETADDEGRLVVLPASMNGVDTFGKVDGSYWCRIPCNIGDRVYRIVSNYHTRMKTIREVEVSRIAVTNSETQLFTDEMILGKTVFLTREEAEKALKEMEGKS